MIEPTPQTRLLLAYILEHIDIPKSYYEKAAARHRSLGDWLKREESTVRQYNPEIRPQGSFRYGTVTRPINAEAEYDLDNVCVLTLLEKTQLTQQRLKQLYGDEIKAYARAHGMLAPVEECNRCWRLRYADEVQFHLDTLPCVPEEEQVIARIMAEGISAKLAERAVGITDRNHPSYQIVASNWHSSNPRGFAAWFEQRAELGRRLQEHGREIRATVEPVPPYEWKTPLQCSIQLLKRHRDVMFRQHPKLAPISMIITNLAARAYNGETDLVLALWNIVQKMPDYVQTDFPKVPNPANPLEDYAEKWAEDDRLEKNFWEWHTALKASLHQLPHLPGTTSLQSSVRRMFDVSLTEAELNSLGTGPEASARISTPALVIPATPKPWAHE